MNSRSDARWLGLRRNVVALLIALPILASAAPANLVPQRDAALNYMLHCQGCHMADGSGQAGYIPDLRNSVARFLQVPAGRAYLGRVPGTAQSLLDDHDRAQVLNWMVRKFDPAHLPAAFSPYTRRELARYRLDPVSQAKLERARLLALIDAVEDRQPTTSPAVAISAPASAASYVPPSQFAICAACHSISTDGASAMGPNLRGVVGRRAGTLHGFAFSASMRATQIVWTRAELDAYLTNPAAKMPGNLMAFSGIPDPTARAAVIDYLERLR